MSVQVLGIKRVLVLIILVAFNAALGAGVYMYLQPEQAKKQREFLSLQKKVTNVRSDIDRLEVEFEQLEKQQVEFDILKEEGFFSRQERNQAERLFELIQERSGVISATGSVQAGTLEENPESDKADHVMLVSPVRITIDALEDSDVFRYLYLLKQSFPGYMSVQNINMERQAEITNTVLRSISSGSNPTLVKADVELSWWTMIPKTDVIDRRGN